jgi:O-antigen/teichoic acid export membrane protein
MLKLLYKSPSLRVAAAFGVGGVSFSAGGLILARVLSTRDYGLVSLVIGLASIASWIAPLGIDSVVTRRGWLVGSYLRRIALAASLFTAVVTVIIGWTLYGLTAFLLICLLLAAAAGGVTQVLAAHFQAQAQFVLSAALMQAANWALLAAAIATALAGTSAAAFPTATLAATCLAIGVVGWRLVTRRTEGAEPLAKPPDLWVESIPLVTVTAASAIFLQLERLVIPAAVGIEALSLYGVLAALVGSPFRMIQVGTGVTLTPQLREAATIHVRRRLLRREGALLVFVMFVGSALIWLVAPPIAHLLLEGRYELTNPLMLAMIVSGVLKVISAFAIATASALAPARNLRLLSLGSWISLGVGVAASFAASRWGLVGVLYGISCGWLVRCAIATWIFLPCLTELKAGS